MPKVGDVIAGKYRLQKVAGEGGMGLVYAAEHLVLNQRVAVKVLLPEAAASEAQVERFAREARAAAKIDSEHVARVLDAGSLESGAPFLVMEYLEGCDLEELLELQKTLPVVEVVDYLLQALEGLAHAHAAGIIHRDLKPANLFLACRPDGSNAIKLLDFGISKTTKNKPEDKRLTGRHVLGSPVYMSPEQLRNATEIDARADIWSIGIVGYELLAGAPPFDGEGVGEIFAAILEKSPVPLSEANPKVPEELSNVIGKCLRREPDERWADVAALARALAPFGSDPKTPIVERTEQVLARARQLQSIKTPVEARRVVDAIDAAAERAMTTAGRSLPAIPPPEKKPSPPRGLHAKLTSFSRRRPFVAATAVAALVAALGLSVFVAARTTSASSAAARTAEGELAAMEPASTTAPPGPPATSAAIVDETKGAETDQPLIMDLPATPTTKKPVRSGAPKTSASKPQRPKFLKTRE